MSQSLKHPVSMNQTPEPRHGSPINPALDLLSKIEVCRLIGGSAKPINPATLYRGIQASRYPRPIMVSPNVARWSRLEVESALLDLMNRRPA